MSFIRCHGRTGPRCSFAISIAAASACALTLGFAWMAVHATNVALTDISDCFLAAHDDYEGAPLNARGETSAAEPNAAKMRKYMAGLPFVK